MSAFQAYAGAYKFEGAAYSWRCYATARVHEIRRGDHAPLPTAPAGRKWIAPVRQRYEQEVVCLVDDTVEEFSQILLQVEPQSQPGARPRRRADVASAAA